MSVQRECAIIKITDRGGFYLFLAAQEHGELMPGQADVFGPFATISAAEEYLAENFANPGGTWVPRQGKTYAELGENLRELLDQARKQRPTFWQPYLRG